jgi:hypothetical protein
MGNPEAPHTTVIRLIVVELGAVLLLCSANLLAQAVPTFVGVRTFMGTPYVTNLNELHADFAVVGVPLDEGTWGWPGERYGPRNLVCARIGCFGSML